ncbi:MAG: phosphoglucosamine mutase [Firmicutes bacterium]|nr:phosphoglucosamine mutase [Bacillota bacterium]
MARLFGTDGVRGVANRELTPELAFKLGRAGAYVMAGSGGRMVVGRDTRISGDMLQAALSAGICSAGVDVLNVDVIPTPAVALLTRNLGADGGVVISASHNPVDDNGIKFFGPSGFKLSDDKERLIEEMLADPTNEVPTPVGAGVGRINQLPDADNRYIDLLKQTMRQTTDLDLRGLKVAVDCANGAAYRVAPRILAELGAEVTPLFNTPDGVNINRDCGSTHPDQLRQAVIDSGADLGLAHDGDADRLLAVDHRGALVDGDQIMVMCAKHLKEQGRLPHNTVVVTVMSNMGLHMAMREAGIEVAQTAVGDRYVLAELLRTGAAFGGEQSGHLLYLDHSPTGDGILSALQLLAVVQSTGRSLADLAAQMERLPQLLENVPVVNKHRVMASPELARAIKETEKRLNGQGRVLVRPSGTESLVRVMAECRDEKQLRQVVDELTELVRRI